MGMSIEEVIDIIKERIKEEKIDVAIDAISKQEPVNVIIIGNKANDSAHVWKCPRCGINSLFNSPVNYCSECGQKLLWPEYIGG